MRRLALLVCLSSWVSGGAVLATACGSSSTSSTASPDAALPPDGSPPGDDASEAAPPGPTSGGCPAITPAPTFCEDFDGPKKLGDWDQSGTVALVDGALSPPKAFQATTDLVAQGSDVVSTIVQTFQVDPLATRTAAATSFFVDKMSATGLIYVITVHLTNAHLVAIRVKDGAPELIEADETGVLQTKPLAPLPSSKWARYAIAVDQSVTPHTLEVTLDGASVAKTTLEAVPPEGGLVQPIQQLQIGLHAYGPSTAAAMRFDDVVFDSQ